jgi:predicted AAA+ superfamily ATPase
LEDTLLGFRLLPWKKSHDRRLIETEKFYLFDVGVSNYLARRQPQLGTPEFGKSFEHFIAMELFAYKAYKNPELDIAFWRTASGVEVDFILNNMEVAIEIKSSSRVHETDVRALKILQQENTVKKSIMISFETEPKILLDNIHCLPWQHFLAQLWGGEII